MGFAIICGATVLREATGDVADLLNGTLTNCTGYTFANLASKPTTLSGFGITDGYSNTGGNVSGDITMTGTGAIRVANGTGAQRPTPSNGMIRYNTDVGAVEAYVQSAWQPIANASVDYGLVDSAAGTTFDYGSV